MSTADSTPAVLADRNSLTRAGDTLLTATQGVAFWAGIVLSFAQVPLLAAGVTASSPQLLVALLVVNVLAMAVGSGYRA